MHQSMTQWTTPAQATTAHDPEVVDAGSKGVLLHDPDNDDAWLRADPEAAHARATVEGDRDGEWIAFDPAGLVEDDDATADDPRDDWTVVTGEADGEWIAMDTSAEVTA